MCPSPRFCGASLLALLSMASCSHSSGSASSGPLNAVQGYVVQKTVFVFAGVSRMHLLVPTLLLPSTRAAAGITFDLDTSPRAAPNTYDYSIPLDSDGDGANETTIAGKAVLSADPTTGGPLVAGFQASVEVTVTTDGGQGVFEGMIELSFDAGGRFLVSGSGIYNDSATSSTISVVVGAANPLHIRTASNEPDQVANACTWSIDGQVDVDAANADGDYTAAWRFLPTSRRILGTNATFTPPGGTLEQLPDSQFEASPCPATGTIGDWAGAFTMDWYCLPQEMGQAALTITVIDPHTIEIIDEDPPGSGDILVYRAARDAHDPHIVHGSFETTDGGGTYEEDFTWVLASDGGSFRDVAEYFYLSGASAGSGGVCGGDAVRN